MIVCMITALFTEVVVIAHLKPFLLTGPGVFL